MDRKLWCGWFEATHEGHCFPMAGWAMGAKEAPGVEQLERSAQSPVAVEHV